MSKMYLMLACSVSLILLLGCSDDSKSRADNLSVIIYSKVIEVNDNHLSRITDIESAKVAAEEIESLASSLEEIVKNTMPEINESDRRIILETIDGSNAKILEKLRVACEIPGVREVVKPSVTRFREALMSL